MYWIPALAIVVIVLLYLFIRNVPRGPKVPSDLQVGKPLPDFPIADEQGNPLSSTSIRGKPAVLVFVRGNWCPFCTKQVETLTTYYKAINDLGATLIFVTPKPVETTKRVAEFFEVEFDFWLDESLEAAKSLGLVQPNGVPKDSYEEYGPDTVWPTALVVDKDGIIRYSKLARYVFNRPDPKKLLSELKKIA